MPNKDSLDLKKRIQSSVSWVVNSGLDRKKERNKKKAKRSKTGAKGK